VDAPVVVFSLASDSPARLELFDLAGRRLATREVGALGAGEHHLRIGESFAPGLYVARLAQHGKVVTARFAVAR
jgi:predicted house-cleaning NTP pyrophosphatase (Maf/HAM1 superfamily)